VTAPAVEVGGRVAAGFEGVADAFEYGFAGRGEHGAAFAAVVDGEPVVDLTAGAADLQMIFSGTKGLVAVCMAILIDRGSLDLDASVARYRPGFREDVLVRHVLSHTSGLAGLRGGFTAADLLDGPRMVAAVAAEQPFWPPGERLAYHALTFGWLCDELVRCVDGRSVGRFFADELAGPLELELWIGLPPAQERRVARLVRGDGYRLTAPEGEPLLSALYGSLMDGEFPWNDPRFHQAEIPAANAIGTARSIARLYASLERVLSRDAVRVARIELSRGRCAVTRRPYAFGAGFELQTELRALGPAPAAFGHTGSGGSSHGYWPDERVGFSYIPNELRSESDDDRARRVLAALYEAVGAR
jgi:CubicO group peptidase (beta-lactamase class C family)